MTRPLRVDAQRNRRRVLDAARAAFSRDGVTASLDDIARAAGVGPGTLYRHFPTRDRLVRAVIDDGLIGIHDLGMELLAAPDLAQALEAWLNAYVEQGSMFTGLAETLVNPLAESDELDSCRRAREAGSALIARAVREGVLRPDVRADDVLDMVAAVTWVGEQPNRQLGQRERLLTLLVTGLRAGAGSLDSE
ncbi:TetR/AcrR family transcriptional regulator [Mycolicibacterium sp. P1-18]|uniref:TetR/AcrR family transcriptional regulator n=1 Tax=Mycolicibacterium sp. P1-18 TaxID=2024615 RepID=UPI0011F09CAE|nr:TetR/AcrR family transcriptional regulator [Mycolicibacterium sp. P1-18]KAA0099799.1 TetR/AcrR family transcriptional regulator [Mycolicibacterium sp. P1-18]